MIPTETQNSRSLRLFQANPTGADIAKNPILRACQEIPRMNLIRRAALCLALTSFLSQGAALAQSPNPHAVSLYNLGLQAYKEGSVESSIIFFRRACDIDPDLTDAQYNLGVLYQSQRRLKEAIPRFQEVLRMKPNDPDAHYQMGVALMDSAQGPQAKVHLQAVPPSSTHFQDAQRRIAMID